MSYTNPPYYLTAYGLAVKQGFKGTLDDWLDSLIGPPGPPGKTAYEYAVAGGYGGTEAEFAAQMARELPMIQVTEGMKTHMADKSNPHAVSAEGIGAATKDHKHSAEDVGAAKKDHKHSAEDVGAAEKSHTHNAADLKDPVPMTGGGTGAQNGADGLANLFAAGYTRLSEHQIVTELPDASGLADYTVVGLIMGEV